MPPSPGIEPRQTFPGLTGLARGIATCAGLGYAPIAPGTVTSLPVALLVWGLAPSDVWLFGMAGVVTVVGVWASGYEAARVGVHDPPTVVVDEVAGMLITLVGHSRSLPWVLGLFVLFRVMDVWKPVPIRWLERLPGGYGIVVDDLVAGVYASLVGAVPHWVR